MKDNIDGNKPLIPIYVGITGHRDLRDEDVSGLENKVRRIFKEIHKKCPDSPIKVLSPLAEGADRLVARVGLDPELHRELGVEICLAVVLPMPKEEYERDFDTEGSLKEFRDFLDKAEKIFELPLADRIKAEDIREYNEKRNNLYAQVGNYIAVHSQIMVALWNGADTHQKGGTAEIVRRRLEGISKQSGDEIKRLFDLPENGPVHYIFTPRKKKQKEITKKPDRLEVDAIVSEGKKETWDVLYPVDWKQESSGDNKDNRAKDFLKTAKGYYDSVLVKINDFNRDVKNWDDRDKIDNGRKDFLKDEKEPSLNKTPGLNRIVDSYCYADTLAQFYQKKSNRMLVILLTAAVAGFFCFGFFDELWTRAYILILFPLIIGIGFLLYRRVSNKKYEDKFYEYRALAEGLRVQFFWKLIHSAKDVSDYFFGRDRREISWILYAIRVFSMDMNQEIKCSPAMNREKEMDYAKNIWIEGQKGFFNKRIGKKQKNLRSQQFFTTSFFYAAMAVVFGFFVLKVMSCIQQGTFQNFLNMQDIKLWSIYSFFLVAVDTLIAIGAVRAAYVEKKAFNDELKNYQIMSSIYTVGLKEVELSLKNGNLKKTEKLIIALGSRALMENEDWLIYQRSKPLEMSLG